MNYKILLLISMSLITTHPLLPSSATSHTRQEIEQEVESWLQHRFAPKLFMDATYTEDLFVRIKQHLLAHQYIQHMPYKELKKIVKNKIIIMQQKKHVTEKWISKHKKQISETIKTYITQDPAAQQQKIFEYLTHPSCNNTICKHIRRALHDSEFLPELIKQTIKNSIVEAQRKNSQ